MKEYPERMSKNLPTATGVVKWAEESAKAFTMIAESLERRWGYYDCKKAQG